MAHTQQKLQHECSQSDCLLGQNCQIPTKTSTESICLQHNIHNIGDVCYHYTIYKGPESYIEYILIEKENLLSKHFMLEIAILNMFSRTKGKIIHLYKWKLGNLNKVIEQYINMFLSIHINIKELMLLNCGVGEDSWESLGQQGDPTSPC